MLAQRGGSEGGVVTPNELSDTFTHGALDILNLWDNGNFFVAHTQMVLQKQMELVTPDLTELSKLLRWS